MAEAARLAEFIERRPFGLLHANILLWTFLALFVDGYAITVVAFATPFMTRDWGIDPSSLGPVLSASMVGVFFGAPIMGYVGDRWGRKPAIVASCILYGLPTLALATSHDLAEMTAWRLISGLGLGGLMPNAIALNAEMAPRKSRAALVMIMFTGATLGSAAPSLVVHALVPDFGWKSLFIVGGIASAVVALGTLMFLPESIRFLAQHKRYEVRFRRAVARVAPDLPAEALAAAKGGARGDGVEESGRFRDIFRGRLAIITPLIWISFVCCLMTGYFLASWLPLLLERQGIDINEASTITALYQVGGVIGALLLSGLIDRYGFLLVTGLFVLSFPAIALMGRSGAGFLYLAALTTLGGVLSNGAQLALNAATGLIYPTHVRAKGVGWAFAVGRCGSVLGPMLGAVVIGSALSPFQVMLLPATSMLLGAAATLALTCLLYRQHRSFLVEEVRF